MNWQWWLRAADNRCEEQLHIRASSYLVVLLSVVCVMAQDMATTLSTTTRVLAVVGIVLTVFQYSRSRCTGLLTICSIVCHLIPYGITAWNRKRKIKSPFRHVVALCFYALVLLVYMASNAWPYSLSPLVVTVLALSILLTD